MGPFDTVWAGSASVGNKNGLNEIGRQVKAFMRNLQDYQKRIEALVKYCLERFY